MAELTARVTIKVDLPDEKIREMIDGCRYKDHGGLCDYDLSMEEAEFFIKNGHIVEPENNDDPGYIPGNWLTADALDAGLITMEEACYA